MESLPIRLSVIQSQGGARGDFVAGWLGMLPQYVQNFWTIDCETGQSSSNANFLKAFPPTPSETDLEIFLLGYNFKLEANSSMWVSATTHDFNISRFFPVAKGDCMKLIAIQISPSDLPQIQWDFFVKTFLTKNRRITDLVENRFYEVDHWCGMPAPASDADRLGKIDSYWAQNNTIINPIDAAADIVLDYAEIFQPGGSQILASRLGMNCSDAHHARWNSMLHWADSPKIIERFGRVFRFDDFKKRHCA